MENVDEIRKILNFRCSATCDTGNPYTTWTNFLRAPRLRLQPFLEIRWACRRSPSCSVKPTNSRLSITTQEPNTSGVGKTRRNPIWRGTFTVLVFQRIKLHLLWKNTTPPMNILWLKWYLTNISISETCYLPVGVNALPHYYDQHHLTDRPLSKANKSIRSLPCLSQAQLEFDQSCSLSRKLLTCYWVEIAQWITSTDKETTYFTYNGHCEYYVFCKSMIAMQFILYKTKKKPFVGHGN